MAWHRSAAAGRGALNSGAMDGDAVLSRYLAGRQGMGGALVLELPAVCPLRSHVRIPSVFQGKRCSKPAQVVCPVGKSPWKYPCSERRAGLSEGAPRAVAHRRSSPCVPRHFLSSAVGLGAWPEPCTGTERGQGRVRAQEAVGK